MRKYELHEIEAVAKVFENHAVLAVPTDTVYGLGVLYGDIDDLRRLKEAKHRPETKPIPMMVADVKQMEQIAEVSSRTRRIAEAFLPGPLTLVVPVKENVPSAYTNGLDTVAVRIPDHPVLLELLRRLNKPLLVTSANQSGAKTSVTPEDVLEQLPDIDGILWGRCKQGLVSTIVDCTKEELYILREGPVSLEEMKQVCKEENDESCLPEDKARG